MRATAGRFNADRLRRTFASCAAVDAACTCVPKPSAVVVVRDRVAAGLSVPATRLATSLTPYGIVSLLYCQKVMAFRI